MADERPTHPTCVEAGRQGFFQEESRGTKRYRAAPIEPARDYLAPASSSGPEQVPLTDMVALADIEHDETVAALYDIVGPVQPQDAGSTSAASYRVSSSSAAAAAEPSAAAAASRASSTLAAPRVAACGSPAKVPHCGGMPVQADQEMQVHAAVAVKVELVLSCSSTFLPPLSGFSGDATDLHFLFARIFIPRHPNALPRSEWLSYPRLFSIVQLYAPGRVWKQGPGNLKGFVIEWCKCLPTFAGLEQREWCMRLNDRGVPGQKKPSSVFKFCLECAL